MKFFKKKTLRKFKLIKRYFRRKYLLWRYKHNDCSDKVIVLKEGDKQLGLTTIIIRDAVKNDVPIFVPTQKAKEYITHEIFKMYQLGFVDFSNPMTEQNIMDKFLVCSEDYPLKNIYYNSREDCYCERFPHRVLVDNQCTPSDIEVLIKNGIKIRNGFIYCPYAA